MHHKKETRGGTRQGSGAKPKYNEPTKTVAFRVPISRINEIKNLIRSELLKWRFDSPKNWTEDDKHENGNYTCRCCRCKEFFLGNKSRVLCSECANKLVYDSF